MVRIRKNFEASRQESIPKCVEVVATLNLQAKDLALSPLEAQTWKCMPSSIHLALLEEIVAA